MKKRMYKLLLKEFCFVHANTYAALFCILLCFRGDLFIKARWFLEVFLQYLYCNYFSYVNVFYGLYGR